MKKAICFLVLLAAARTQAQSANQVLGSSLSHYVFDQFLSGKVYLHSGDVSERKLNYNALTREMIFEENGQPLAIANPENVDSVIIAGHKFIPADKKFYEWIAGTSYPAFAEYVCTVQEEGVSSGYGSSSNTSASNTMKSLHGNGTVYAMKLPEDFKVNTKVVYYLYKDNKYHLIKNSQQLSKLVPAKKDVIQAWVKEHNTDFSKRDQLQQLIAQIQ